jgi:hypothetical protein
MGPRTPGLPVVRGLLDPYIPPMPRKPIDLSPGFARRFAEDMRAYPLPLVDSVDSPPFFSLKAAAKKPKVV